jgi:GMP synthase (glutamine-hydrolysing)
MKVLIIDNNIDPDSWGATPLRRMAALAEGATVYVRRAPHEDLPSSPTAFDRIIVSGSKTSATEDAPWIDSLHRFIRSSVDHGVPFLGVCYGHQMLCRALGGKPAVRRGERAEFGWTKIERTETRSSLLEGIPQTFYSFSAHFDEVASLPQGMRLLARSQACAIQACELEGKPVFGIQFHPEKNADEGEHLLKQRKRYGLPQELLNPGQGKKLFDQEASERIFKNFLGSGFSDKPLTRSTRT